MSVGGERLFILKIEMLKGKTESFYKILLAISSSELFAVKAFFSMPYSNKNQK